MIFESHAHYEDKQFDEDREELLNSLKENGIEYVVNVSSSLDTMIKTEQLMNEYSFIYGTAGVHPEEAAELNEDNFNRIREMALKPKIAAIGEIGLDYYWDEPERPVQKYWFERQMELAKELKLPMIIHSRDAAQDTYDMMKACNAGEAGGVVHCFSYGTKMAAAFLDMGFYLGIGGVVTFSNAKKVKEVAAYMPLDRLLLETDSPYLAPVPNRGRRNSSLNLIYIAEEIAAIRGIDAGEVIRVTMENAKKMYRL